ncbi:MAG: 4'-phosphopantetheinyl transferase [Rhodococcus sp. (in: high G+C Gram-positive bacteria)]
MLGNLLARGVVAEELFEDPPGLLPHPLEAHLVEKAVDKRKREFTSARHCARLAMGRLGLEPSPIMRGDMGSPVWPSGVVGSLTHCDGYRAAAVGYALAVRSVGIDAEPHETLPDGVLGAVSLAAERDVLASRTDDEVHWDKLLFCAKEATYKAWYPLTGRWLGFEDAHITFERDAVGHDQDAGTGVTGTFRSRLLVPGDTTSGATLTAFDGRWAVSNGLVLTAITVF